MTSLLPRESLADLLHVKRAGGPAFTAQLESFWGGVLDADVWARAALAVAVSAPGHTLFALHGRLPAGLTPGAPLSLGVTAREEPKDVLACEVELSQGLRRGSLHAHASARRGGPGYCDVALPAALPDPDSLPSTRESARAEGWPEAYACGPVEFRRIGPRWPDARRGDPHAMRAWLRPRAPLPDAPASNAAALVFAAAFYPHWEFERRIGPGFAYERFELLVQTFALHEVAHWRDWWLLDAASDTARAGLAHGSRRLFARDGRLLATGTSSAIVANG
jgi:acyl-CoA thioesterase